MPTETLSDGSTVTWTGKRICYCVRCREVFNSPAAFDAHLRRDAKRGRARHDVTGMPRNERGYFVTMLDDRERATSAELRDEAASE